MVRRQATGYVMRQEVNRAINANRLARMALQRILDEQPGPAAQAMLIAKTAAALGENLEALREIEQIVQSQKAE